MSASCLPACSRRNRRFAWPVLAPLLSSLVVIATYLTYAAVEPHGPDIPQVGTSGQLILAIGTTLGVVVLSLCLVSRCGGWVCGSRPRYAFEPDARRGGRGTRRRRRDHRRRTATVARAGDPPGRTARRRTASLFITPWRQTVYLVPWSVLAVPVAISVYPVLATAYATGDEPTFRRLPWPVPPAASCCCPRSARRPLIADRRTDRPPARGARPARDSDTLALAVIRPSRPGCSATGCSRCTRARCTRGGQNRYAAVATVTRLGHRRRRVVRAGRLHAGPAAGTALTTANSVGMTVLAVVLVVMIAGAGRAALRRLPRAAGHRRGRRPVPPRPPPVSRCRAPFAPTPGCRLAPSHRACLSGVASWSYSVLFAARRPSDVAPMVARLTGKLPGKLGGKLGGRTKDQGDRASRPEPPGARSR